MGNKDKLSKRRKCGPLKFKSSNFSGNRYSIGTDRELEFDSSAVSLQVSQLLRRS